MKSETEICLRAVLALLADGQVWKLNDIVRALPDFTPDKVRMTVSNDAQQHFVSVAHGCYRLAEYHLPTRH
jgi:hypothetical protein